jgi:two-component system, chemotaxis family, CheB/CheR fusion protein
MGSRSTSRQPRAQSLPKNINESPQKCLLPIVGIGASAGGLEAFTQVLRHLSIETGIAFVLIQHLDPQHKSLLTEILARTTQMPVSETIDGIEIEPNHVYIIPPNTQMILVSGRLQLSPREKTKGVYHPIDLFFRSIATACGNQAIGVVLSGADGDGALGLSAIKAAGGMTFAQDLPSSQFGGMPQSAANTGQVDFILPPAEIAEKLNQISGQSTVASGESSAGVEILPTAPVDTPLEAPNTLHQIFELLRLHTGVDFARYKYATLNRRIQRRMFQQQIIKLEDYLTYLQANPAELDALYRDVLIGVTSFFRDPEAFQFLQDRILPQIVQQQPGKSPIRIWVAGCATGEEAYSVAICLLEVLAQLKLQSQIQIFATDLNEVAIETARSGIYAQNSLKGISPERLRQFFVPVEGGYQISKSVRDLCVFAKQNLCSDPPFSRLDLIICRNVLIYFGAPLQKKVMQTLHYGLKPTGLLMLGSSETTSGSPELFNSIDKKYKFYAKKLALIIPDLDFATGIDLKHFSPQQQPTVDDRTDKIDLQQIVDDILWKHYAPVGVIVNANDLEILQFRGDTSPYLSPAPGNPSFNLLKMIRADLRVELRAAIGRSKKLNLLVSKSELAGLVKFEVIPFQVPELADRYLLILFEHQVEPPVQPQPRVTRKAQQTQTEIDRENIRLRQELTLSQEQIQTMIQEQESIEQDIRAVNEEMLSSNEEFQSTNEELETAKEEIQAANEELSTVNEELRSRNLESTQLNNDLINILSSVQLPILIVGNDLRIGRFTPMAAQIFNLIPTDIGRLFSDIRHNLTIADLDRSILQTIDTLNIYQQEIQDLSGHWYHLTIRPYKTRDDRIAGATILLVDVHALKHHAQELQTARDYANAIVETIWEPLIVLNSNLQVVTANRSFYQMFEVAPTQVEGQPLDQLGNGQWNIPGLRSQLEVILHNNIQLQDVEVEHTFEQIGQKTMLLNARQISTTGNGQLILLAIVDITERKQMEVERTQLLHQAQIDQAMAEEANLAKDVFLSILSHELRNPLTAMLGWSRLLRSGKLNAEQAQRGLEVIDRSATNQNQLIGDLLDVSSITNGKLRLDIQPIDLIPIIEAAIETVAFAAKAKNIQIHTKLDPSSSRIFGDSTRLQQVLWNLLGNAIKFTEPGGQISVYLLVVNAVAPPAVAYAQIQVIDDGQGIDPEFLPHVFDRFLQADSSSTRNYNGLGLGLTIVRHLVELHGGNIIVASQVGVGSTFTIYLPLANHTPNQSALLPVDQAPSSYTAPDTIDLTGIHVLIVDDEADIRALATMSLEQYGATVTATASVAAALQTLQTNPQTYQVLLSDIGMPGQDGWALIRQVRALSAEAGGQIPAAALTAYTSNRDQEMAIRLGFQTHIAKPIEPDKLAAIVADLARDG